MYGVNKKIDTYYCVNKKKHIYWKRRRSFYVVSLAVLFTRQVFTFIYTFKQTCNISFSLSVYLCVYPGVLWYCIICNILVYDISQLNINSNVSGHCQCGLEYADCVLSCEIRLPHKKKNCSSFDIKLHLKVWLLLWGSGQCRVPLHCHYSNFYSDL